MMRRPPRSTQSRSSAASDVYKRQVDVARNLRAGDLRATFYRVQAVLCSTHHRRSAGDAVRGGVMNAEAVTDALVRHMADETTCAFFDDRLACDTALYYPNGDSVVVYVTDHDALFEVSDYSEGMALAMQRLHRRSGVLATVGQHVCAASGLTFTNGRVSTAVSYTHLTLPTIYSV